MRDYTVLDGEITCLRNRLYDEAYKRGYADGLENTVKEFKYEMSNAKYYQRGLEDAWECVLKIGKLDVEQQKSIFGTYTTRQIALAFTVQQAMQKIKDYEEQNTIAYHDDFATALEKMYEYEERQTEKTCDNCLFHGHCQYYGKTLTWLLGDKNEQTGEKVCKSWKPNGEQMRKESE